MADSAAVTYSNIHSQPFWNVYNLLNNRSNVADPNPRGASGSRKIAYSHDPFLGRGFDGYPLFILEPFKISIPSIGSGDGIRTGNDKNAEVKGETIIEVRGQEIFGQHPTYANKEGKGIDYFEQLCDKIMQTLQNRTNRDTLRNYAMGKISVEEGNVDFLEKAGELIYIREFRLSFNTKLLAVSS